MISQPIHRFEGPIVERRGRSQLKHASTTILKADAVAKMRIRSAERRTSSYCAVRTFSVLNLFLWLSLFLSVRAQSSQPFPAAIELSILDGSTGFVLNGEAAYDQSGFPVSSAGDVNGDGVDDLIIGAYRADPSGKENAGKSYVIFGKSGLGSIGSLELSALDGTTGFVLNGETAHDNSGQSVSSAGDVNGDGVDDLIIGAWSAEPSGKGDAGKSYVIFGKSGLGSTGSLELSALNGTTGFVLIGEAAGDYSGRSVSSAGDINGDGVDDIIIGAYYADPSGKEKAGKSYVIFGKNGLGSTGSLELSALDGTTGFMINGVAVSDNSGRSVSSAGDVNGDGVDDLIIGAHYADPSGKGDAGKSYVIFGKNGLGSTGSLELSALNGTTGFVLNGEGANDESGLSVSSAGDVNGDLVDDLIIGAYGAEISGKGAAGKSYVIFGKSSLGSTGSLELSSLDGIIGFVLNGEAASDKSGVSVSSAGDVNGDGVDDLIIGAFGASPSGKGDAGKSYVIFGKNGLGSTGRFELSTLDGSTGFVLNGEAELDNSGRWVSHAGDVNGDGVDDLIIGAFFADPSGKRDAGKSYVVFGRRLSPSTLPGQNSSTTSKTQPPFTSLPTSSNPFLTSITTISTLAASGSSSQGTTLSTIQSTSLIENTQTTSSSLPSFMTQISSEERLTGSSTSTPTQGGVSATPSPSQTPIIIGVAIAVAALACSVLGGVVFWVKKRNPENRQSDTPMQQTSPDPAVPAGYVDLSQIAPGMQSARVENQYDIIPSSKLGHYKQWPSKQDPRTPEDYDAVDLEKLNQQMDNYQEAKRNDTYDDIDTI